MEEERPAETMHISMFLLFVADGFASPYWLAKGPRGSGWPGREVSPQPRGAGGRVRERTRRLDRERLPGVAGCQRLLRGGCSWLVLELTERGRAGGGGGSSSVGRFSGGSYSVGSFSGGSSFSVSWRLSGAWMRQGAGGEDVGIWRLNIGAWVRVAAALAWRVRVVFGAMNVHRLINTLLSERAPKPMVVSPGLQKRELDGRECTDFASKAYVALALAHDRGWLSLSWETRLWYSLLKENHRAWVGRALVLHNPPPRGPQSAAVPCPLFRHFLCIVPGEGGSRGNVRLQGRGVRGDDEADAVRERPSGPRRWAAGKRASCAWATWISLFISCGAWGEDRSWIGVRSRLIHSSRSALLRARRREYSLAPPGMSVFSRFGLRQCLISPWRWQPACHGEVPPFGVTKYGLAPGQHHEGGCAGGGASM